MKIISKVISFFLINIPLLCISFLIIRNKKKWIFGGFCGRYRDNSALFFDYIKNNKDIRCIWITNNEDDYSLIRSMNYECYYKSSLLGVYHSLTSGCYIFSSYIDDINSWCWGGAIKVNLWHGLPFKKIERDIDKGELQKIHKFFSLLKIKKIVVNPGVLIRPNLVVAPSDILARYMASAFGIDDINVIRANIPKHQKLLDTFVVKQKKKIIYMPTWRDGHEDILLYSNVNFNYLNELLIKENLSLDIQLHPNSLSYDFQDYSNIKLVNGKNIIDYEVIITDYSSVIYDCILLKKKFLLYCFDIKSYLLNERGFYFDYSNIFSNLLLINEYELYHAFSKLDSLNYTDNLNIIDDLSHLNSNDIIFDGIKKRLF